MNRTDKIWIALAFLGLIVSLGSLGFIGPDQFFKSSFAKDFLIGLSGSLAGAVIALIFIRFFAKRKVPSVFVSYHYANKDIARRIANELKKISNHVWIDEAEIRLGDNIRDKVETGLRDSEYLVVLLSNEANKSSWVNTEISKAMEMGKMVIPIKIDGSETPDMLKDIAYADLGSSFEKGIEKVKKVLIEASYNNKAIQPTH